MKVKRLQDIFNALPSCMDVRNGWDSDYDENEVVIETSMENLPLDKQTLPGLYKTIVVVEKDRDHPVNPTGLKIENFIHTLDGDVLIRTKVGFDDVCGKRSYLIDHIRYLMPDVFDGIRDPLIKYVANEIKSVQKTIRESGNVTEIVHNRKHLKKQDKYRAETLLENARGREQYLNKLERIRDKLTHPVLTK